MLVEVLYFRALFFSLASRSLGENKTGGVIEYKAQPHTLEIIDHSPRSVTLAAGATGKQSVYQELYQRNNIN